MIKSLDQLLEQLLEQIRQGGKKTVAVAQAADEHVLKSLAEAAKLEVADFILVADPAQIEAFSRELELPWLNDRVVPAAGDAEAAAKAVELVRAGQAQSLMKGHLHTGTFLKAILDKEKGLRGPGLLSACCLYENPLNGKLLFLTDGAMNIAPDLMQKKQILENAAGLARRLGVEKPKVAVLAALEIVNPELPETTDAAILSKMAARGQIPGCIVDGPLAMDNALSAEAARLKHIDSPVAGELDILLVPNLTVGNAVHKTIAQFTPVRNAALTLGASVPVIMTSRTDSVETKTWSIVLGCYAS